MRRQPIWIESFDYFRAGNRFAGSCGPLAFKLFPEKDAGELRLCLWSGLACCEKAENVEEQRFELSPTGLQQAVEVITARAAALPEEPQ